MVSPEAGEPGATAVCISRVRSIVATFRRLSPRRRLTALVVVALGLGLAGSAAAYAVLVVSTLNQPPPAVLPSLSPAVSLETTPQPSGSRLPAASYSATDPSGEW